MLNQILVSIPTGFQLAMVFQDVIRRWHQVQPGLDWAAVLCAFPAGPASLPGQVERLGLINCFQWHLEDKCRENYASQAILAELKHAIDLSNQRRVSMIDAIDDEVARQLLWHEHAAQPTRLALITPGNLMDRLSILELKHHHAQSIDPHKTTTSTEMIALIEEQIEDLCTGMDELVQDLLTGRLRLKVYRTVKIYGTG